MIRCGGTTARYEYAHVHPLQGARRVSCSRARSLMADLPLHATPNLSTMRLASILALQLPRAKPLPDGGPPRSSLMDCSCSGVRSRGLPGPTGRTCHLDPRAPACAATGGWCWDMMAPRYGGHLHDHLAALSEDSRLKPVPGLAGGSCLYISSGSASGTSGRSPLPSSPALPLAGWSGG